MVEVPEADGHQDGVGARRVCSDGVGELLEIHWGLHHHIVHIEGGTYQRVLNAHLVEAGIHCFVELEQGVDCEVDDCIEEDHSIEFDFGLGRSSFGLELEGQVGDGVKGQTHILADPGRSELEDIVACI